MESQGTGNGGPYMPRHLDLCSRPALLSLFLKNLFCDSVVSVAETLSEEGECIG